MILKVFDDSGNELSEYKNVLEFAVLDYDTLHDFVFSKVSDETEEDEEDVDEDRVEEIVMKMISRLEKIGYCNDDELFEVYLSCM